MLSDVKSAVNLMYIPLYVTHYFSPAAFKILSLAFISLNMVCLGVAFSVFILVWIYCASSVSTYFYQISEVFGNHCFKFLSVSFYCFSPSGIPISHTPDYGIPQVSEILFLFNFFLQSFWLGNFYWSIFQFGESFYCHT